MEMKKLYADAITVQDACNLSGVVLAWARAMETICNEANEKGYGTEWKNNHPANVLFASKVASLTRCEDVSVFARAYEAAVKESGVEDGTEVLL